MTPLRGSLVPLCWIHNISQFIFFQQRLIVRIRIPVRIILLNYVCTHFWVWWSSLVFLLVSSVCPWKITKCFLNGKESSRTLFFSCSKSAKAIPSLFSYTVSNAIKPLWNETASPDHIVVLDISKLCRQYGYSLFFVVKCFQKHSHGICSNFAIMEATKWGTRSLKRFLRNTPGTVVNYKGN